MTIGELREDAKDCRACPLWERATQTVFGEGPDDARIVMVGEQPGDREDLEGRPFVGPAGAVLDRALVEAGFDRGDVYVTNAVKHFKWKERGKRRIHDKPSWSEVAACSPWLRSELDEIRPELVVCLGATAAQALLGKHVRVLRDRGRALEAEFADHALVTIHPSAVLRADEQARAESYAGLLADLRIARSLVA